MVRPSRIANNKLIMLVLDASILLANQKMVVSSTTMMRENIVGPRSAPPAPANAHIT